MDKIIDFATKRNDVNKTIKLIVKITAVSFLVWMFALMVFSVWDESGTMDELAHIPSGYSYITEFDYRLNPEHPPLIKDLTAVPLLFLDLNFPTDNKAWTTDLNGQWDMGRAFLYGSGNDPDKIISFSRFPVMILAIVFGWMLFLWTKKLYGNKVGLLTLFLFCLSPTMIAHSRYVTTDLGASFGFFIGISTFVNYLYNQTGKNLIIAGVAFGIAQLLKFSAVLLAPIYITLIILWAISDNYGSWKRMAKDFFRLISKLILIGLVSLLIVWPVYQLHVMNYPIEKQYTETQEYLATFGDRWLAEPIIWLSDKPVLRSIGHYFLGILMVIQRAAGGNTAYFMGEVTNVGSRLYFPLLFFAKELLGFYVLLLISIIYAIKNTILASEKSLRSIFGWMRDNFALVASLVFIVIYLGQSMSSPLNIGFRHVMPILPFIYLLVARQIVKWSKTSFVQNTDNIWERIKNFFRFFLKFSKKYAFVLLVLIWMFLDNFVAFPHYLSYFNSAAGGVENGYKIAVDSNYDWGQDLKRLNVWINEYNECALTKSPRACLGNDVPIEYGKTIDKIAIDYFGAGNPGHTLGVDVENWWSSKGAPEGWFGISATFLMGSTGKTTKGFTIAPEETYSWLKDKEPVARAGTSIFIYKF